MAKTTWITYTLVCRTWLAPQARLFADDLRRQSLLRAKLGLEYDVLIKTARHVGYLFVPDAEPRAQDETLTDA